MCVPYTHGGAVQEKHKKPLPRMYVKVAVFTATLAQRSLAYGYVIVFNKQRL
jgi:hypothetical protein